MYANVNPDGTNAGRNAAGAHAPDGALNARHVTPGLDANLAETRGGSTYYYMADGLGSVRNVVDSSETVQDTYDYYAFGNTLLASPANVTNPYRYTGREYESGSVLDTYYYRNRYYVSQLGIFMSRDAQWADPQRGWGYVRNAPTFFRDAVGLAEDGTPSISSRFSEWNGDFEWYPTSHPGIPAIHPWNKDVWGALDEPGGRWSGSASPERTSTSLTHHHTKGQAPTSTSTAPIRIVLVLTSFRLQRRISEITIGSGATSSAIGTLTTEEGMTRFTMERRMS